MDVYDPRRDLMPHTPDLDGSSDVSAEVRRRVERLPNGVYVPMLAFFTASDEVDTAATQRHTARLLAAGCAGLVVHGSNGEAVHLSRRERRVIIEAVVDAVRHEADHPHPHQVPIIAGCSAQSLRETVELCAEAAQSGATHAIILPPGYYASLLTKDAVVRFFHDVADASPIPVLIYNFPAAANGVDLESDTIARIAEHPRIVGVKLTCGNTGKLARVVAEVGASRRDFFVAGGSADFILQGMVVGAHGTVSGFANLAPHACARIIQLFEAGQLEAARALQAEVARADWLAIRYGFVGVKAAMPMFHGERDRQSAEPRRPLARFGDESKEAEEIRDGMKGMIEIERALRFAREQASPN
jgi:dihydrodipicolinate synthase/N-acetylneuraminate lyase